MLQNDLIGLLYDIKELVKAYKGNLIALVVGITFTIFNQNRNNPGMFSHFLIQ